MPLHVLNSSSWHYTFVLY